MKRIPGLSIFIFFLSLTGISCNTSYQTSSVVYNDYRISDSLSKNPAATQLLYPYWKEVENKMNERVGFTDHVFEIKELGRFMTDAYREMAIEKYGQHVDASIMNPGGIRIKQLPQGKITNGIIFELMPFDNILVLQKMKGSELQQFLDRTTGREGWPMTGIEMDISEKKAVNIRVGNKPLDVNAIYTIANVDFLANGGENLDMLKAIPQINNGYLVRDAIFDYIKKFTQRNKPIGSKL